MEYLYYMANGGMEYGYAPVQSLAFFEESTLNLSLSGLWGCIVVCRAVGAIFLCLMIYFVSICVKRSLLSVVTNAALLVIPVCFSNVANWKYLLPLPTGLLYATGYFFPDIYDYRIPDDMESFSEIEKYVSFPAFTQGERVVVFSFILIIMVVLVFLIFAGFLGKCRRVGRGNRDNRHPASRRPAAKKKKFLCLIMLPAAMSLMTGCVCEQPADDETFSRNMYVCESTTDRYSFSAEEANIMAEDLETGETFPVLRDVFLRVSADEDDESRLSLFATENYLFYSKFEGNEWQIHRVRLTDFEDTCTYTTEVEDADACSYYLTQVSAENYFLSDALSQESFYINRKTGKWTSLGIVGFLTLGDYGKTVYYEDKNSRLTAYDVDTQEKTVYDDLVLPSPYSTRTGGSSYYIEGDYCYYRNMLDNDYIYRYCFSDGSNKLYSSK
jgi:hypothetical protein